jgi:hypothetical protein
LPWGSKLNYLMRMINQARKKERGKIRWPLWLPTAAASFIYIYLFLGGWSDDLMTINGLNHTTFNELLGHYSLVH